MHSDIKTKNETKAIGVKHGETHEVRHALDELMRAFDAFKQANNERLAQIDQRLSSDVVTEEKLSRVNSALSRQQKMLDHLKLEQNRPLMAGGVMSENGEHKAAFNDYLRKGASQALDHFESKALTSSSSSGGYLVPESVMVAVSERLQYSSPMRRLASVQQVSSSNFKKVLTGSGPGVNWATSETQDGTISNPDGDFIERDFSFGRLVAKPAATQSLLDDAAVNLEQWLADEIYIGFAEKETSAFIKGKGATPPSPKGFLRETLAAQSANLANDKIGFIASGVNNNWPQSDEDKLAKLLEMVYALKASYRHHAHWLMNKTTIAAIRSWVDDSKNPLWQPPTRAGAPATLLDYPVIEIEDMPNKDSREGSSSFAFPIAFGDFARGYLIADRMDMRILRDPYSSKPNVVFYTTKTIGGGATDLAAIKLMKCVS